MKKANILFTVIYKKNKQHLIYTIHSQHTAGFLCVGNAGGLWVIIHIIQTVNKNNQINKRSAQGLAWLSTPKDFDAL